VLVFCLVALLGVGELAVELVDQLGYFIGGVFL
jgi:hypothetical protein